jgi:hypothetical protein
LILLYVYSWKNGFAYLLKPVHPYLLISVHCKFLLTFASGSSSTTKILGIGGLSKDALVADAKRNLLENYPLKENQTLANISVDFKNSYFLIVYLTKVTVTADIVEFK